MPTAFRISAILSDSGTHIKNRRLVLLSHLSQIGTTFKQGGMGTPDMLCGLRPSTKKKIEQR